MQLRADHIEKAIPVLQDLIKTNPLAHFTTAIPSLTYPTIQVSHIPFIYDTTTPTPHNLGVLRGHIARANPQWKAILESLTTSGNPELAEEVCLIFTGPDHYVTPKFYVETKPATGKVVPTWNYTAVQIYGRLRAYWEGEGARGFLRRQVSELSEVCEREVMGYDGEGGRPESWKIGDAPEKYIEILMKGIAGLEIVVERCEGKFKMSQEMGKRDRDGVVRGLRGKGGEKAEWVAEQVERRGEEKDRLKTERSIGKEQSVAFVG